MKKICKIVKYGNQCKIINNSKKTLSKYLEIIKKKKGL